jgi:hypothetical protein
MVMMCYSRFEFIFLLKAEFFSMLCSTKKR